VSAAQLNNNKDLEVDMKKEEPSFFGSFFSSSKSQQQKAKKGPQAMEAARCFSFNCCHVLIFHAQPPQVIRPQAALNDRETLETEVISAYLPTARYDGAHRSPQSCLSTRISIS
jgi:hypothetical protein